MLGSGDMFGCDVQVMCVHGCRWAQVAQRLSLHPGCSRWISLLEALLSVDAPPDWAPTTGRQPVALRM